MSTIARSHLTGLPYGAAMAAETSVEAQAEARLRQGSYVALHDLSCNLRDGVLTLRGRVPSYFLKQIAQSLLASLEGVLRINNELEVAPVAVVSASATSARTRRRSGSDEETCPRR